MTDALVKLNEGTEEGDVFGVKRHWDFVHMHVLFDGDICSSFGDGTRVTDVDDLRVGHACTA